VGHWLRNSFETQSKREIRERNIHENIEKELKNRNIVDEETLKIENGKEMITETYRVEGRWTTEMTAIDGGDGGDVRSGGDSEKCDFSGLGAPSP